MKTVLVALLGAPLLLALDQDAKRSDAADPNRIRWVHPFKEALRLAKEKNRLVFARSVFSSGGPSDDGVDPDCDGTW